MLRHVTLWVAGTVFALLFIAESRQFAAQSSKRPEQLSQCWQDLASEDASLAYRAIWLLAGNPEHAVKLLSEKLSPAPPPDKEKIQALIEQLENPKFAIRDKASKELEHHGDLAEPQLR